MEKIFFLLVVLSLHRASAGEAMTYEDEDETKGFRYLQRPLVQVTDPTEASKKLIQFTKNEFLKREVVKVGENIYVAIGWALANSIMVEGDDGIIIVDTTETADSMKEIMKEFRKITKKPVKAIIFTHFHTDHITGTNAILVEERSRSNETISIYAHATTEKLMFGFLDTYDIGFVRALRQFGSLLPKMKNSRTGSGIGPELRINTDSFLIVPTPTVTYVNNANFSVAGVDFELIHTPGETDDQTTVFLKKEKAVLSGDNIYKCFPNLYAIRGSPARNAQQWYQSLDRIRKLRGRYLINSHTRPVIGVHAVDDTILIYRDAIKYVHDQTLRLLNKGYTAAEITQIVKLPDKVRDHPFLQEHYGTVSWSIRGIFTNYLGWFSGTPTELNPLTDAERASRMLRLVEFSKKADASPAEIILREAQKSHERSIHQYQRTGEHSSADDNWALELVNSLTKIKALDGNLAKTASQIQISALRSLGVEQISANGRNYYLTYASEVENGLSVQRSKLARGFVIKTSTVDVVLGMLCAKVDGLKCQCQNFTLGFHFKDINKSYKVTLRNSVCDIFTPIPPGTVLDVHLTTTTTVFKEIKAEEKYLDTELALGNIEVLHGSIKRYKDFLECFDPVNST